MQTLADQFRSYLISHGVTPVTAKNYASDIRKFLTWFEGSFNKPFTASSLTPDIIVLFKNSHGRRLITNHFGSLEISQEEISARSFKRSLSSLRRFTNFLFKEKVSKSAKRSLSSLRRFTNFLFEENLIETDPFKMVLSENIREVAQEKDQWRIHSFKDHLFLQGASRLTIKNYAVDIMAFTAWLGGYLSDKNVTANAAPLINQGVLSEYQNRLTSVLNLSESTIERKLSAIRKYLSFARGQGLIEDFEFPEETASNLIAGKITHERDRISLSELKTDMESLEVLPKYSKFPPLRLLQKMVLPYFMLEEILATRIVELIKNHRLAKKTESGEELAIHKQIFHHIKNTRPKWYKTYHNYSIVHYLHFAILVIYASIVGFVLYTNLFAEGGKNAALAGPISPPRVLSFQGRLTDSNDTPITAATDMRFIVYNSKTATGSALLWQDLKNVTPDENGTFSILLGESPNTIPATLFTDNDILYLGITVGQTAELTPRQRLASVAYATNSESLQGMLPITDSDAGESNVILALDSSGNLTVGGTASPTFAATGGQFKLSGKPLLLSTEASSDGDVDIVPDGLGKVDIQKPLINSSLSGNISEGAFEINDKVAILATESAVASFVINNNTTGGDIFTASSSGTTRFVIANNGDVNFAAGSALDTISTGTLSIGNTTATTLTIGRSGQGITLPGFTGTNGILYGTTGTGVLAQASTSTSNLCLVSGASSPSWGSCESGGTDVFWSGSQGAIFPNNSTVDFLIGAQATSSAKFAVLNVNSGTPVASISANSGSNATYLTGGGVLSTTNMQTLNIGSTTTGNVVIDSGAGTITLSDRLNLSSNITDSNSGQYLCVNTTTFEVGRNNTACSASSIRFKEDVNDLSYGLSDVMELRPVTFYFKPEMNMSDEIQVGFIAEEVEKVIPELVSYDSQGLPSGVNYPNITALLTSAIQDLAKRNSVLQNQVIDILARLENLTVDSLTVTADNVYIAEQSLREYIASVLDETIAERQISFHEETIVSPYVEAGELRTNTISPLGEDPNISIALGDSKLEIKNSNASDSATVASIDNTGNATFSGSLRAGNIEANNINGASLNINEATVSGTLHADNIRASAIEGLDDRIASVSVNFDIASIIGEHINSEYIDLRNISSDFATFQEGLIALGPSTFTQGTFMDSLAVGTTLILGPNSIDSLGESLEIQALRQGAISLMAGAVKIETDGTLKVTGNAEFAGNVDIAGSLSANVISPLPNSDLVMSLKKDIGEDRSSQFTIQDASNSAVLSINDRGNLVSSGSATFNKLNFSFVESAYATSDVEAVATGSAGLGTLKRYRTELTIKNPNVTEESLIYITPAGNTDNQVLYLLRQVPEDNILPGTEGSFTVGLSKQALRDIKFNWVILN